MLWADRAWERPHRRWIRAASVDRDASAGGSRLPIAGRVHGWRWCQWPTPRGRDGGCPLQRRSSMARARTVCRVSRPRHVRSRYRLPHHAYAALPSPQGPRSGSVTGQRSTSLPLGGHGRLCARLRRICGRPRRGRPPQARPRPLLGRSRRSVRRVGPVHAGRIRTAFAPLHLRLRVHARLAWMRSAASSDYRWVARGAGRGARR